MTIKYANIDRPNTPQVTTVEFVRGESTDENPDLSFLKQEYNDVTDERERAKYLEQDRVRLAAYNAGDWFMRGLWVDEVQS